MSASSTPPAGEVFATDEVARLNQALEGRYRIERKLGEGGMAIVYLAEDLRHHRHVAVKVLRPELGAVLGPDRFIAEIQVTATLQHPHLLPLFDSGEAGGLLFYVMPYVEGESLRARLIREKQLALDETLRIGASVASALDYAHQRGVIHRDLKPENILLHAGQPIVADFGIALAVSNAGGARVTQTGISLGTPQYMSPEQATGDRPLDGRTDIYALGSVLYEMLAGEPPHRGSSAQSILAKVLTEEPRPLRGERPSVPEHVESAIHRALAKLPADRFARAEELAEALDWNKRPTTPLHTPRVRRTPIRALSPYLGWGVAALAATLALLPRSAPPAETATVSSLLPPPGEDFSEAESFGALSPDGSQFVFVSLGNRGDSRLWIRQLSSLTSEPLPETEGASAPFWSPDGRRIGFFSEGQLRTAEVAGGSVRTICQLPGAPPFAGSWGQDESLAVFAGGNLLRLDPERSACESSVSLQGSPDSRHPSLLPDGRHVLFTRRPNMMDRTYFEIAIGDFETGEVRPLLANAHAPTFVPPDILVFGRGTFEAGHRLWAQRLDLRRLEPVGEPVSISGRVRIAQGVLAYAVGPLAAIYLPEAGDRGEILTDRSGRIQDTISVPGAWTHQWVPGSREIVHGTGSGVVRYDLERGLITPVPTAWTFLFQPTRSPDGRWVAHGGCAGGLAGGCGMSAVRVGDTADSILVPLDSLHTYWPTSWSSDARTLIFARTSAYSPEVAELWKYDWQTGEAAPFFHQPPRFAALEGAVSPNGRWLAYRSNETGTWEIYVTRFDGTGGARRVSLDGGRLPRWRSDGGELFFQSPDGQIMVAEVFPGEDFSHSAPRVLFTAPAWSRHNFFDIGTSYDVSSDGELFTLRMSPTEPTAVLVQNWQALLK